MAPPTVTRARLADLVHRNIGLSRRGSARIVDQLIEEISQALVDGGEVKLSRFGSFRLRHKRARTGRNPKTGIEAPVSERHVVTFRASRSLKKTVNDRLPPELDLVPGSGREGARS